MSRKKQNETHGRHGTAGAGARLAALVTCLFASAIAVAAIGAASPDSLASEVSVEARMEGAGAADGLPGEEEMLERYAAEMIVESLPEEARDGEPAMQAESCRDDIESEPIARMYDAMLPHVRAIAAGEETSTQIDVTGEEALGEARKWHSTDLGVDIATCGTDALQEAIHAKLQELGVFRAEDGVLMDYPYLFYWMDKAHGYGYSYGYGSGQDDGGRYVTLARLTFIFPVAPSYRASSSNLYRVKSDVASQVSGAIARARQIADRYKALAPYERLLNYMNEVNVLTSYNHDAASWSDSDVALSSDPWQIVWVFDGDTSTNVVCEGYAKAFKYLSDLSGRTDVDCRVVLGFLNEEDAEHGHMWNIVRMDDNRSYLVDTTNCDANTVGYPQKLFLQPPISKNANGWYSFSANGTATVRYKYASSWLDNLYSPSFLSLSMTPYSPPASRSLADADVELEYSETTYDGTYKRPSVSVSHFGLALTAGIDYTVSYSANLNAGTATVTVAPASSSSYVGTKSVTFEIRRRPVTVRASDASMTYGDAVPALSATVEPAALGVSYSLACDATSASDAGTYPIRTDGPATQGNYTVSYVGATLTVARRDISTCSVDAVPAQTWTGSPIRPTPAVRMPSGVAAGTSDYTLSYASNVDVGMATITATGRGNLTGTRQATFEIVPARIPVPEATSFTYDGTWKRGIPNPDGCGYHVSYADGKGETRRDAGTYVATVTPDANHVWEDGGRDAVSLEWSIARRHVTFELVGWYQSATYDGTSHEPVPIISCSDSSATRKVSWPAGGNVHAGEQAGVAYVEGTDNYEGFAEFRFDIARRPATISVADAGRSVLEPFDPPLTATVSGVIDGDALAYHLSRQAGTEVGEYRIDAVLDPDDPANRDYDISVSPGTFTISPVDVDVSIAEIMPQVWCGSAVEPAVQVTTSPPGIRCRIAYSDNVEVGMASVTAQADVPGCSGTATRTFLIGKRPVSVTPSDARKVFGEDDPQLAATVDEAMLAGGEKPSYEVAREEGEDVRDGGYAICVSMDDGANPHYTLANPDARATFTIDRAPIDEPQPQPVSYDGQPHAGIEATEGCGWVVAGDEVPTGTDAGWYETRVRPDANHEWADGMEPVGERVVRWEIAKAHVTPTIAEIPDQPYWPGGLCPEPEVSGLPDDLAADGERHYTVSYENNYGALDGEAHQIGTPLVRVTIDSDNYEGEATREFRIVPRSIVLRVGTATKRYGQEDPKIDVEVEGAPEGRGDELALVFNRRRGEDVTVDDTIPEQAPMRLGDPYDVSARPASDLDRSWLGYTILIGSLDIMPAVIDISVTSVSPQRFVYDGTSHEPEVSYTLAPQTEMPLDPVGVDGIQCIVSYHDAVNAGSQAIDIDIDRQRHPNLRGHATTAFLIDRATGATVAARSAGKAFGEEDPELTADETGAIREGDAIGYRLERDPGEDIGTYQIHVVPTEPRNYEFEGTNATFTISPAETTVAEQDDEAALPTYDGQPHSATEGLAGDGYELVEAEGSVPEATDAGAYRVLVRPDANHVWPVQQPPAGDSGEGAEDDGEGEQGAQGGDTQGDGQADGQGEDGSQEGSQQQGRDDQQPGDDPQQQGGGDGEGGDRNVGDDTGDSDPREPRWLEWRILPAEVSISIGDIDSAPYDPQGTRPQPAIETTPATAPDGSRMPVEISYEYPDGDRLGGVCRIRADVSGNFAGHAEADVPIVRRPITVRVWDARKGWDEPDPEFGADIEGVDDIDGTSPVHLRLYREGDGEGQNGQTYRILAELTDGDDVLYDADIIPGTLTVGRATASITDVAEIADETYDGQPHEPHPAVQTDIEGEAVDVSYAWADNVAAGDATVTITATSESYEATATRTFAIRPREAAITIPALTQKTYGEQDDLRASLSGFVEGDSPSYRICRSDGEDVGTYDVWVELLDNPNYAIAQPGAGTLEILPAAITEPTPPEEWPTYDGEPKAPLAETPGCGYTLGGDLVGTDAGEYVAYATPDQNHVWADAGADGREARKVPWRILPMPVTVSIAEESISAQPWSASEEGNCPPVTVTTDPEGIECVVSYENNHTLTSEAKVVARPASSNYDGYDERTFAIVSRGVTVSAPSVTVTYGEEVVLPEATVTGLEDGQELPGEIRVWCDEHTDAGTYEGATHASVSGTDGLPYAIACVPGTLTILPAEPDIEIAEIDPVAYDGTDQEPTPSVIFSLGGEALEPQPGFAWVYEDNRDAGEHAKATVRIVDERNYVGEATREFAILPRRVRLLPRSASKTFGDADPALAADIVGEDGQPDALAQAALDYDLAREPGEDAGEYPISVSLTDDPNFSVEVGEATLLVAPRHVVLFVDGLSPMVSTYDGTQRRPTPSVSSSWSGSPVTYHVEYGENVAAGRGAGTLAVIADGNFRGSATMTFDIARRPATIAAHDAAKGYGEPDPELVATVTGIVGDDVLSYSLARETGEDLGDYPISVGFDPDAGANANYSIEATGATLRITEHAATFEIEPIADQTYTGRDITPQVIVRATPANARYDIQMSDNHDAGTATVTVRGKEGYGGTATSTFRIKKAEASLTIANASKSYGQPDPPLTARIDGLIGDDGEDAVSYSLARQPGENVGSYEIYPSSIESTNYAVQVAATGRLTISRTHVDITIGAIQSVTYAARSQEPYVPITCDPPEAYGSLERSYADNRNAGTATVTVTATGNYEGSAAGHFTIDRAPAYVRADDKRKVVGEADPELTATVTGVLGGDTIEYSLSREPGRTPGFYPIRVTGGSNPNYAVSRYEGTLTIAKIAFRDVFAVSTPHAADIQWLADNEISTGWMVTREVSDFRPKTDIIRADMSAFLFRLAVRAGIVDNDWKPDGKYVTINNRRTLVRNCFADVSEPATPHAREIWWMAYAGISTGWTEGGRQVFKPYNKIVRQDMAAFLYRLAKAEGKANDSWKPDGRYMTANGRSWQVKRFFSDVSENTPHSREVWWLAWSGVSGGWQQGDSHVFRGMNTVLRQDMAAFLRRLDGLSAL